MAIPIRINPGRRRRVKYFRSLDQIEQLSDAEREALRSVSQKYVFRANDYYLNLIDWHDPSDPIRQLVIPKREELLDWGKLDASNEAEFTMVPGLQHKYPDTALLLTNEVCGAYCRYCFRKRLFMDANDEVASDLSAGFQYISEHPEITNVLLTGGDPLLTSTRRLVEILERLRKIHHVRVIRIGSKMPAFDPFRILDDPELEATFREYSSSSQRIYLMAHFDHPRELTEEAIAAIDLCIRAGVICVNQCPIIRGVNDDQVALSKMFQVLSRIGCPQYYVFQGRPTAGNEPYTVPVVTGWELLQEAFQQGSGLEKRARFVMSHETGKIEILAIDDRHIYARYHQAVRAEDVGRFMVYERNDDAYWLDQLRLVESSFSYAAQPEYAVRSWWH